MYEPYKLRYDWLMRIAKRASEMRLPYAWSYCALRVFNVYPYFPEK